MYYNKTCEHCGMPFTAQKANTRFCSKSCADAANKERLRNIAHGINQAMFDKDTRHRALEIMSPTTLANYFGVSRRTAYRYLEDSTIHSLQLPGKTLIRKADIDKLFDEAEPYRKRERKLPEEKTPDGYITVKETAEKYDLSAAHVDKLFKKKGITVTVHRGKKYYSASEVANLMQQRANASHPEIAEWYTCKEIQEKYGLKQASVWDIVSKYCIPKKNVHGTAYYSKVHFDRTRGQDVEEHLYYTVREAMEKYQQTRDQVYNVLRYNGIERFLDGRIVRFRRKDYDECMKFTFKD